MKIFTVFTIFVFELVAYGENLENYDRELSTIKLLYYRRIIDQIDDPVEIRSNEWSNASGIKFIDPKRDVKVLIHGWNADSEHVALETVRNSYLKLNSSHVLMADWRDIANMRYSTARGLIAPVGKRICKLLKVFVEHAKTSPKGIHVVGHSLGAHVGTHIGRCFNASIGRMTALDPAGPLFTLLSTDALSKNDFQFVDSIHTSAGLAGEFEIRGTVDFYPNRGRAPQPGCEVMDVLTLTSCSHFRAPVFFSESILVPHSFPAHQCDLSLIQLPLFPNCLNGSTVVFMGEHVDQTSSGAFYLETFSTFPFGKGS